MMQNLAKDEAGNVWEVDAAGNPVRLHTPAAAPGRGRVFSLAPSPKEQRQEARADEDQQLQRDAAARAERAAERADRTAQRQAAAAERVAAAQSKPTEFQSKSAGFLGRMMEAERDFAAVPASERGPRSLPRQALHNWMPGVENTLVNSSDRQRADQAVENFIAASLRQESGAAISPMEFERQYKIFYPAPGDSEETIKQKAAARAQAIQSFRLAAGPLADASAATVQPTEAATQRADNEVPNPTGAALKPPAPGLLDPATNPGEGVQATVASGATHITHDPRLSAQVDAMINAGATLPMINAVLQRQKFPTLNAGDFARARAWMAKPENRGKKYYGADVSRTEDMSMLQRAAGSETGTFLGHMGNAATAGIPAALAGPTGQGALDASAATHPDAAFMGGVVGGVTGAGGLEAAAARTAPVALAKYAPRIADTLYGGLTGLNSAREGEGVQGAALGAGAGLFGGLLGERAMRGLGAVTRGVRNSAVQTLNEHNIPMTVGRAVGNSGFLGKAVRGAEDRLSGIWGVGDVIGARQREGVEAVAQRMANDAVAPIGGAAPAGYGEPLVNDLLDQGSDAYTRATAGAHVPLDPQFAADMAQTRAVGTTLPGDLAGKFDMAINNRIGPVEADSYLTGDSFQQAVRGLKGYRAEVTKPGFEQDYRNALSQGIDALRGQMNRGGGQDVVQNLANADEAWKRIKIIQRATNAARNGARSGEIGLPMPSHFNDAATAAAAKYGGPRFNGEFLDAAQQVLPNKVPDSGTAGRLGFGAMLAGGAGVGGGAGALGGDAQSGAATGLGLTLMLAAGGSKPAQRAMTKILLDRPDIAIKIGRQIGNHANIGGFTGAGVLTPLTVSP